MSDRPTAHADLGRYLATIVRELRDISFTGPRARNCTVIALSATLAVLLALSASLGASWWAAISGVMASQATSPASIARTILRIAGTVAGAALGVLAISLFAYDHLALCLFMFIAGTIGVLGMSVSPHGYAWLLGGLTTNLVIIAAMNQPDLAPGIAAERVGEVVLGCFSAVLVAILLAPDGAAAPAAAPGWSDPFGTGWPPLRHAVHSGIAIMLMPVVWNLFGLPSLSQMAITATAVMGVPVPASENYHIRSVVTDRCVQRIAGCLFGGLLGLAFVGVQTTVFPIWLGMLFCGIWLCALVQSSPTVSYAGVQTSIAFIVTVVQGPGPANSLLPGTERLVGILGGLGVLLLVGFVIWPPPEAADPRAQAAAPEG